MTFLYARASACLWRWRTRSSASPRMSSSSISSATSLSGSPRLDQTEMVKYFFSSFQDYKLFYVHSVRLNPTVLVPSVLYEEALDEHGAGKRQKCWPHLPFPPRGWLWWLWQRWSIIIAIDYCQRWSQQYWLIAGSKVPARMAFHRCEAGCKSFRSPLQGKVGSRFGFCSNIKFLMLLPPGLARARRN